MEEIMFENLLKVKELRGYFEELYVEVSQIGGLDFLGEDFVEVKGGGVEEALEVVVEGLFSCVGVVLGEEGD
jgi:hypothetical protein